MAPQVEQFVALMAAHQREVYRYIVALVPSAADADDVFQETSLKLWKQFERFEAGSNFAGWACRVAYYTVLDHRKRTGRDRHVFSEALIQRLAERRDVVTDTLARRRDALDDCLRRLNTAQRELIDQRYGGETSIRELAEQTGRPVNTLYKTLDRVRQMLLDCVEHKLSAERAGGEGTQ